ncbi:MAG TPA: M56 family metallopeptidase, partial [Myxococcales bacterium]|nr:M56 family metallopeptidase [Myxococcales bacterium]
MTWTLDHLGRALAPVAVDASVKVTVLLLAAALATVLVRRAPAAARHFVWSLAVAGALALPVLGALLPSWRVAVLPPPAAPEVIEPVMDVEPVSAMEVVIQPASVPAPVRLHRVSRPAPFRLAMAPRGVAVVPLTPAAEAWAQVPAPPARPARSLGAGGWVAALWAAGVALALLRLLAGRIGVRLLARRARPVVDPGPLAVLERLRRRMGIRRAVALLQADRATLPMTWGTLHPAVLLPAEAHAWTTDRLELVLLHELAHVRRLDALTQLVAQLACAIYWFHPLVWLAARRMRALREYACDDHVLNCGTRASAYAGEILELLRSLRSDPLAPASATLAMARRSHIEGRLVAILDPGARRRAFGSRSAGLVGALGLLVLMPLAALQPTAAAQPQPQDAPKGTLPRLSTKESERRKSAAVPEVAVEPGAPVPPAPPSPPAAPAAPAAP